MWHGIIWYTSLWSLSVKVMQLLVYKEPLKELKIWNNVWNFGPIAMKNSCKILMSIKLEVT